MYKRSLFILITILLTGTAVNAQEILKGYTTVEKLSANSRIFPVYVNRYEPVPDVIDSLNSVSDSVRIMVYMGTWCKESKRYIPELVKTLAETRNPAIDPVYIAVGYPREDITGTMQKFSVTKIPTIIVMKNGGEIGRIEEKPLLSIEEDLWNIIARPAHLTSD
ncbi:thioredoxin family protein [Balneola sp. MJW-20]|uniref:thioredoxin family protein n=1 Tax=Gracilimonas aurantiaca TaxID=3234185 RepID=UPI003466692D